MERLYALIVTDARGKEGVLRRVTPYGTMPWITDDWTLVPSMVAAARESDAEARFGPIRVATFQRKEI